MNILVTGGCGFIGSNFIHTMLAEVPEVAKIVCLDLLTYAGNLENLADLEGDPRLVFIHGDIADREMLAELFREWDFTHVVNFAAETHVDRSLIDVSPFLHTNTQGTAALLDACRTYGIERMIQVSTDEVYGALGPEGCFTESSPLNPSNPYAASKAAADLMALAFHHSYATPVIVTRCTNNYGPYQFPEKLIPLMILNAMSNKPLPVYGDGLQVRDWIHVHDHCTALVELLRHGQPGRVYNIGAANEQVNLNLVKTILSRLGKPETLIEHVGDRPGHDRRYALAAVPLREEIGWAPRHEFVAGLEETIRWYQDNHEWWGKILDGEYRDYYDKLYGRRGRWTPSTES